MPQDNTSYAKLIHAVKKGGFLFIIKTLSDFSSPEDKEIVKKKFMDGPS